MRREPAQHSVRALPRQSDSDMLRGQLGQSEEAEGRQLRNGLIHPPDELVEVDTVGDQREL